MYLSAAAIAAMKGEERVHFVNPACKRINKSLGDAAGLKNMGVHMMTIAPGDRSSEYHCHKYEDEAIYVLSGTGTAVIGEEKHKIGPGDFIGLPGGGPAHETINDGTGPLVCLVIGQRLPQDVVDYPRAGKRLYRNSGQRDMVDYPNIVKRN
ncbi:MAG: cupin domain-containing protein [Deltaproteobacteria bacterium]|nr:cupin domain-containing protein [Deltaproteobacteria bacterium]